MKNKIKSLSNGDFSVEPLTPEIEKSMDDKLAEFHKASQSIAKEMEAVRIAQDVEAETFWNSLSYEDKCNAFHAVVSKIFEGEIREKGSYRYVLYDIFGFGPDMYVRGMNCDLWLCTIRSWTMKSLIKNMEIYYERCNNFA